MDATLTPPASRSLDDIVAQGYAVRTLEYLREGWNAFLSYPVGFLGFALVLSFAAQAIPFLAPMVGQVLSLGIQMVMMAGLAIVMWRQLRHQRSAWEDFFPDWRTTAQLFVCTVVAMLLVVIGFLLLILPGLYLLVGFSFSYMLIVDRRIGVWQALEGSRRVVHKNWWGVFGLTLVMLLVLAGTAILGSALLGLPIGYALAEFFPSVNLDELPLGLPPTGLSFNLGVLMGIVSGGMVGGAVGIAVSGCMLGAAYADIFGLPQAE